MVAQDNSAKVAGAAPIQFKGFTKLLLDTGLAALTTGVGALRDSLATPTQIQIDLHGSGANIGIKDAPKMLSDFFTGHHTLEERIITTLKERSEAALTGPLHDPELLVKTILGKPLNITFENGSGRVIDGIIDEKGRIAADMRILIAKNAQDQITRNPRFQTMPKDIQGSILREIQTATNPEFLGIGIDRTGQHSFEISTGFNFSAYAKDVSLRSAISLLAQINK